MDYGAQIASGAFEVAQRPGVQDASAYQEMLDVTSSKNLARPTNR